MRPRAVVSIVVVVSSVAGCGTRTGLLLGAGDEAGVLPDEGDPRTDGGPEGRVDGGPVVPGPGPGLGSCPSTPPSPGDPCGDFNHYCHYYSAPDASCVRSVWCRFNESKKFAFEPISDCDDRFDAPSCTEGLPCGVVVPPYARCIVEGVRVCACEASGKLACSTLR